MKNKSTVIAVVNQKGGTAKTTTVENLGIGLAREGYRWDRFGTRGIQSIADRYRSTGFSDYQSWVSSAR